MIPPPIREITKTNVSRKLAAIYDVLGFIFPCAPVAKDVSS